MLTKEELIEQRQRREEEEAKKLSQRDQEHRRALRVHESQMVWVARDKLDNELPPVLLQLDAKGIRTIWVTDCSVLANPPGQDQRTPLYDVKFSLGFTPRPEREATQLMLLSLRDVGYVAEVVEVEEPNYDTEGYGDGEYRYVPVPGTHTVYYLKISWE